MERDFDVVVIGSGSAGNTAATALSDRGLRVAVVDERPFGGTCQLRGCDPKKVLVAAARAVQRAASYANLGIFDAAPSVQWDALMRFKRTFTDPVPGERREAYAKAGIAAIQGSARFEDERTLLVNGDRLRAEHFVIAVGARPGHVADGDDRLLTSEGFMELESLPHSLLFAGGGYIAFEFAHVAVRCGAQVTILHDDDRPLRGFDADIVGNLIETTRQAGIAVELGARVSSVERAPGGVTIHAQSGEATRTFHAREGVLAAGRAPDLDSLDLEAAHVERGVKGVKVNEYLQSVSNASVYAAGDCADAGGLPLTPVAGYEGTIVASNIADRNARTPRFRGLASIVYSIPALAQTGTTEERARERSIPVDVHQGDMSAWYSTRQVAGGAAFYKAVIEKRTGKILGATILGPHAEEQINVISLAIAGELRAKDVVDTLFAYPTGSSDLEYVLGTGGAS